MTDEKISKAFLDLVDIIHRLRAPGGCPWDREQTPSSLKPYIIEEAYEVVEAIDSNDPDQISEELGDLLLQVVLQAEIASEKGLFSIDDVIGKISSKLISRHPHVFSDGKARNAAEVLTNWEKLKKKEKTDRGLFDGLPKSLPMLQRACRIGEKAARVGFDWSKSEEVREKVAEELQELDEAISSRSKDDISHELGDLLFAIAQWARHLNQQPEEALRSCCARFLDRFSKMEHYLFENGKMFADMNIEQLEAVWQRVKGA